MDLIRARRHGAFGTRLRRLSERLDREVQAIYREHAVDFEPRWYPVVVALHENGPASVGELSAGLGVTHAAVSQVRSDLAKRGLVGSTPDPNDQRRQVLQLTDAGRELVKRLEPLWSAVARATEALCLEHAPGLIDDLEGIEAGLEEAGLKARVDALLVPAEPAA